MSTSPTANSEGDDGEYARDWEEGLKCDKVEATHSDTTLVLHRLKSASIHVDRVGDDNVGGDDDIEVGDDVEVDIQGGEGRVTRAVHTMLVLVIIMK